MSSSNSPEQSNTPHTTLSREISDTSMVSTVSFAVGSGGESPPRSAYPGHTLSPPQMLNVVGSSSSSTPNSPHLGVRPSSGNKHKGMRRKFLRKGSPQTTSFSPQNPPPQDSLETSTDHQENKALFMRMLKSWQLQPKKMRHFRRAKRRADKQYHSDDGYTSDPGILREEEDDETDDPDEIRRHTTILDLERKADKIRRSLAEEEDVSLHDHEEDMESITADKPTQHKFRLYRNSFKSKSYYENQRVKLDKLETQLKELREGGSMDSRASGIRGKIGGGLRGMSLGIKGRLTHAGSKLRRKRISEIGSVVDEVDEEPIEDEEEDEDDDGQGPEPVRTPEQDYVAIKEDLESLRLASEEALEQNRKWKDDVLEQNERLEESLTLFLEKLEQERERGDRLEGQLNDITELHQHAVDDLRTQLTQIEHTTTNRCQDFEDAVDDFQTKFDNLNAYVHKLMDSEVPKANNMVRRPMASLLSILLQLLAFILKLTSMMRNKPWMILVLLVPLVAVILYYSIL